jgi:dTMP kinase
MAAPGILISFEGSEGCGKSTQIRLLRSRLDQDGHATELMREPGGSAIGESIRHLLQHAPEGAAMTAETELLLFAASRAQLVREKIRPLLASGTTVLLDRFLDSTTVYQGIARGLPRNSVDAINSFAVGGTLPHLTFLLDMDADTARGRILQSGRELDRIESQPIAFFEKVRQGYLEVAAAHPDRVQILDASLTPEDLHELIWSLVASRIHAI